MFEADHPLSEARGIPHDGEAAMEARDVVDIAAILSQQLAVYTAAHQTMVAERLGLSATELKALELVQELDALPTGQLALLLGISWGGTTALVNRLESSGFVRRERHPLDRRVIIVSPVAEHCETLKQARQAMLEEVRLLSRQFDPEQIHTVHAFLQQYVRGLRHDMCLWLQARNNSTH
ncbi:MarR family winged helix-turn-helix transcriptional regulator [Bordetella avium]|uniref:MarR-family transcriptional regulator n=1 Tax=Bordetella avium (strain 197N) TaxID=360910 RepID=Q2KX67_BORA1|nr:MarR family transcriptional regulator [Bordetella avium]AZY53233.1 MarR family transcriptional regulator [Bordetella avium]RIQ13145.1 MarR family transcriptional regulator [Bordetella avium]RIQ37711.1 MarR family transcriptional regulator [Bordetella avium]RIQ42165.1 MarR family transcriptional regulator [Bordetella avium]RIQ42610.1 MarR family transcriptional regulator [Bordetella avium]